MNRKFASPLLTQLLILINRDGDPYKDLDPLILSFYAYIARVVALAGMLVIIAGCLLFYIVVILSCFGIM
jgi:hypothetical protein